MPNWYLYRSSNCISFVIANSGSVCADVREESPIVSLSWWGWGSCYESVVLGAHLRPREAQQKQSDA